MANGFEKTKENNFLKKLKSLNKKQWFMIIAVIVVIVATVVASVLVVQHRRMLAKQASSKKVITTTTEKPTTTEAPTTEPLVMTKVHMECSSFREDLKITIINEDTKRCQEGTEFSIVLTDAKNKQKTYSDKNKNGKIYISKINAGKYKVKLIDAEGYEITANDINAVVKAKPDYKPVKNIKAQVKQTPKEDPGKVSKDNVKVEKQLEDTVPFQETYKKVYPEEVSYEKIDISQVKKIENLVQVNNVDVVASNAESTTKADADLVDVNGEQLYVQIDNEYRKAKHSDYNESGTFYVKKVKPSYTYYKGWQNINGSTYYYVDNVPVKGDQVIQHMKFNFNDNGTLNGTRILGIDVSYCQKNINWADVKKSGVDFVIIRVGFRGYLSGSLNEDSQFRNHIRGAKANGLDVGIYFFSQAVNEQEGCEEASLCLELIKGYNIKYPIFIDSERSGGAGRADKISKADRTAACRGFCETIRKAGYKTGVYASKYWYYDNLNVSQLSRYNIWLAQYNDCVTYNGRYDMWQYSSKGNVPGVSGNVDMNLCYKRY